MAISNRIAQLTALALKDKVLTFVERQTIVKAAIEEGIAEDEINSYLNKALEERMKTYSKEELTSCPCCGGQIPLISDECFYCGAKLDTTVHPAEEVKISGEEADIIRGENKKTADEQQNPTYCPDCGMQFPLISNICPSCGHVLHAHQGSDLNIRNLIANINDSITALQNSPMPTFKEVRKYNKGVIMLFTGTILLTIAFSYPMVMGGFMIILAIFLSIKGVKGRLGKMFSGDTVSPVSAAEEAYYKALNERNMYIRLTNSIYGDNPEAKEYISKLGSEIGKAARIRRKNRSKLITLFVMIALVGVLLLAVRPSASSYYEEYLESDFTIFKTENTTK